jgi:hypothetical protein
MNSAMRIFAVLAGLSLSVPVAVAQPAKKPKQSPPACGARILPLVEGNSWTYVAVPAANPILQDLVKIAPRPAQRIVVTVKKLESKGGDTVAHLEEKVLYEITPENKEKKKPAVTSELVINSTITCNKTKFEISPDSFFFAGEPGGYRELTFDKLTRTKDTSLKLDKGVIGEAQWREDIVAQFTRKPAASSNAKMSGGKLELERAFTPENPEAVFTAKGEQFPKAEKLHLVTTGRVTFDAPASPTPKPSELPANWVTKFWFQPDLGVIQTLNMYAHQYQIAESTLK